MRKIFFSLPLLTALLASCNSASEENNYEEVDRLYDKTCQLTKIYTDSITHAEDSASLSGLMERFDARLSDLNFSVKAETDYSLDEGKNDTIFLLIDSLRRAYDIRLYRLGHPVNPVDSVTNE